MVNAPREDAVHLVEFGASMPGPDRADAVAALRRRGMHTLAGYIEAGAVVAAAEEAAAAGNTDTTPEVTL